jgi:hypothetical protein
MRRISRGVLIVTVVGIAVGVVVWRVVASPAAGLCANRVLRTIPAPDGASRAVIFERDCGATTGFSTQVDVLATDAPLPDTAGNAFVADDDHGRAPTDSRGALPLEVLWRSADSLEIGYSRQARVFRHAHRGGHVWVRAATIEVPGA